MGSESRIGLPFARAATAALLLAALTLAGCETTSGLPSVTSSSPATNGPASAGLSQPSAGAATSVAAAAAPTVTVTAPSQPRSRTVTRTIQVPGRTVQAPASSDQLESLYENSVFADAGSYYTNGGVFFDTPSQNIGCFIADAGTVSCAITHYDFPQPGPDCDAGIGATIDGYGNPSLTNCDGYFPVRNRATVLSYGSSVTNGSFACVSESTGVTCFDTGSDTGFSLSKEAYSPVYS